MSDDDKLFERFKELLEDHEEPYVLGSWERFEKHKARSQKKQKQKMYIRAAAAILILSMASAYIWMSLSNSIPVEQITMEQPRLPDEQTMVPADPATPSAQRAETATDLQAPDSPVADRSPVAADSMDASRLPGTDQQIPNRIASDSSPYANHSLVSDQQEPEIRPEGTRDLAADTPREFVGDTPLDLPADTPMESSYFEVDAVMAHVPLTQILSAEPSVYIQKGRTALTTNYEPERAPGEISPVDDLPHPASDVITREDLQLADHRTGNRPLTLSIAYASVMNIHDSQTDLGSGAGVYAGWNFAPGFTLSTGVAVSQNNLSYSDRQDDFLAASQMPEMEVSGVESTIMSGDHLSSVQVNFLNLEIPLDLRYHISNSFSISAGVSSVTFLREEYDYNFEFAHRTQSFGNNQTDSPSAETVVTYRTTQTQSEPALNEVNWGAFYTFSVGYQHDIFNRYTASFEPFFKVPAGPVASRGVRYSTGGVQLRISF